jgi:hypothetical protein
MVDDRDPSASASQAKHLPRLSDSNLLLSAYGRSRFLVPACRWGKAGTGRWPFSCGNSQQAVERKPSASAVTPAVPAITLGKVPSGGDPGIAASRCDNDLRAGRPVSHVTRATLLCGRSILDQSFVHPSTTELRCPHALKSTSWLCTDYFSLSRALQASRRSPRVSRQAFPRRPTILWS